MSLHDILNRLAAQEQHFLGEPVLAPVIAGKGGSGSTVGVRIAGIACRLKVLGASSGWAILQPQSVEVAQFVRPATPTEREAYLKLLPQVRLIAVARLKGSWLALPAHEGNARFKLRGAVPVQLTSAELQPFDTFVARFDGNQFWFDAPDTRRSPALAAYLREALAARVPPDKLDKPNLSREERAAYNWVWDKLAQAKQLGAKYRLSAALAHGEGTLLSFIERDETYTVTYRVGEQQHVSTVRKDNLTILASGICLSGLDANFDLTSIVGVMREAAGLDDFL